MQMAANTTTGHWALLIEDLTKRYSDNVLFQNLNLELRPGMAVHIQGPNGSGKTQLMLVIAGLVEPDSGRVSLRRQDESPLAEIDPAHRARFIRYVPYLPGGLTEIPLDQALLILTGRLRPFSLRSRSAAAADVVSGMESELRDIGGTNLDVHRPLGNYSLGQQKRFMAASALGTEPRPFLVMLDEPLAGLDEGGIRKVLGLMREAKQQGIALLVSEHRGDIFNFGFDAMLRLPYRPGTEAAPAYSPPAGAGADGEQQEAEEIVFRAADVVAGYPSSPVHCPELSVSRGQLVVIRGPNGSGKTGFVRGLLGHPGTSLSGQLEFEGANVPDLRSVQRRSALRYLSQGRDLFPDLTVRESIEVASRGHATELGKDIADIERFLGQDKLVQHLSAGGRALLGLAQALAGGAKFLILDEPGANTDADNRRRVWELIDRARQVGQTAVLVIEHDLTRAPAASSVYEVRRRGAANFLLREV